MNQKQLIVLLLSTKRHYMEPVENSVSYDFW